MELQLDHVTKQFRDKKAVDDISLCITPGVWGLLGANGAGKTTLMRIIAGIMNPTSGEVLYDGVPVRTLGGQYREIFGYLPQEFGFCYNFTVTDYLEYVAALKGLSRQQSQRRIGELLEQVSLGQVRRKKIARLSGGMKRRVGIAQALLNDPEVLVLDEPTSGLDPGERVRFRNLLSEFAQGRIVLISTHIVPDVEYIATRHAIVKEGKLLATGATEELVQLAEGKVWNSRISTHAEPEYERCLQIVSLRNESDDSVSVRYLAEQPFDGTSLPAAPRLEDLYLWMFPQDVTQSSEYE
ncbi:MAG: ABC transporter ATP-binding protein [Acetatifactor sp.]|nr:ABC transporter ATP-binding protein [Acetatifactor sp.]